MSMMVRTGTLYRQRNRRNSRASSVRQVSRKSSLAVPSNPGAGLSVSAPSSPRNSITSLSPRASLNNTPRRSLTATPNRSPLLTPRGSVVEVTKEPSKSSLKSVGGSSNVSRVRLSLPEEDGELGNFKRNSSLRVTLAPSAAETDRRHSSASVCIAVDDTKKLYAGRTEEKNAVTSYGSIVYQFRDTPGESAGTIDFLRRSIKVISTTVFVTVMLVCLTILPLLMVVIGIQYLHECPKERNIPIYLLVGGCFGLIKMISLLWRQMASRRYEQVDTTFMQDGDDMDEMAYHTSTRVTEHAISVFLITWFAIGNYWVYSIWKPRFEPLLQEPNDWCSKTVYVFAMVQIFICYLGIMVAICTIIGLLVWNRIRSRRNGKV